LYSSSDRPEANGLGAVLSGARKSENTGTAGSFCLQRKIAASKDAAIF